MSIIERHYHLLELLIVTKAAPCYFTKIAR